MSTAVVSSVDASPVLEAGEQVFNLVALPIEQPIIAMLDAVLRMGWDTWRDALIGQSLPKGSGAVSPVSQQEAGGRKLFENGGRSPVVVRLPFGQMQEQRSAFGVAHYLQLGCQAASAASDTSG